MALIHRLAVTFYLGYYGLKVFMVLVNRREQLAKFKKKTLVLEIALPLIFIATGVMMISASPLYEYAGSWFTIKMVLLVLGIATGIIGVKKFNKVLVIVSILAFLGIYGYTEAMKEKNKRGELSTEISAENIIQAEQTSLEMDGSLIYNKLCVTCHGKDGKKGLAGAFDLSISTLNQIERIDIITDGKESMAAYKDQLTEEQIENVADFIALLAK